MTRAIAAVVAILAAAIAAVLFWRRSECKLVTRIPAWSAADDEGDALEPDVYLVALLAAGQTRDEPVRPLDWHWD